MKAIKSEYILTCNNQKDILKDNVIVFDDKLIDILPISQFDTKYPNIKLIDTPTHTIIIPGLINTHCHLEFSKNKTTLDYGHFVSWLKSVIINRENLISDIDDEYISSMLDTIVHNGTTSIGAVSSYGFEINACKKSPIRTVLFNEAIGSNPQMIDDLYSIFLGRLNETYSLEDDRFIPAIAIHSPYSIHPILTKKILQIAKEENHIISTHFMESIAEREWLESSSGDFYDFFDKFLGVQKSLITPNEFLKQFDGLNTMFVHNTVANEDELKYIKNNNSTLIHCPISNRLLTNNLFDINKAKDLGLSYAIGTDGLSSNYSLNMFEELRVALFTHTTKDIKTLATDLLYSATNIGAKALNINSGSIEIGKNADFLTINIGELINVPNNIAMQIILHTTKPNSVYIGGEIV